MSTPRAPIVLFVYKRPEATRRLLESLARNPESVESELFVFADGARDSAAEAAVRETRQIARSAKGFRSVSLVERERNQGLSKSVVSGVTEVLRNHEAVIVLEDDLEVAPGFLGFMNAALERYRADPRVFAVSGWAPELNLAADFSADVYLCQRALCWGWATWRDRWGQVDWQVSDQRAVKAFSAGGDDLPDMLRHSLEGKNDSWAVRWAYDQFRRGQHSLVPVRGYVANRGQEEGGTHSRKGGAYPAAKMADSGRRAVFPDKLEPDPVVQEKVRRFYGYNWKGRLKRALGLL